MNFEKVNPDCTKCNLDFSFTQEKYIFFDNKNRRMYTEEAIEKALKDFYNNYPPKISHHIKFRVKTDT